MAALTGAAQRQANWRQLSRVETSAAVTELHEILADRDDGAVLLAEVAGLLIGFHQGALEEPKAKAAAQLCIAAGADETLIPRWIEEGRHRAATAALPPFSGGLRQHP